MCDYNRLWNNWWNWKVEFNNLEVKLFFHKKIFNILIIQYFRGNFQNSIKYGDNYDYLVATKQRSRMQKIIYAK